MGKTGLIVLSSLFWLTIAVYGSCPASVYAQAPSELLQYIPPDMQFISMMDVGKLAQNPLFAKSKQPEFILGKLGSQLTYVAYILGIDPIRDISHLVVGRMENNKYIYIAFGNAIARKIRMNYSAKMINDLKVIPVLPFGSEPEGAAILSDNIIAIGTAEVLAEVNEIRNGKIGAILANQYFSSQIRNLPSEAMIWFIGRSALVLSQSPFPTPAEFAGGNVQSIAGIFTHGDALTGNITIHVESETAAGNVLNLIKKYASASQLQEDPNSILKLFLNAPALNKNRNEIKLSFNVNFDSLVKVWSWVRSAEAGSSRKKKKKAPVRADAASTVDTDPILLSQTPPKYTDAARAARAEGTIQLEALICKDGTACDFIIKHPLGYGLEKSAIDTIANCWRFIPAIKDGVFVNKWVLIDAAFKLY